MTSKDLFPVASAVAEKKEARYRKYERILRHLRQRIFDYDLVREEKASRLIGKCQAILAPKWDAERRTAQARRLELTPSAFEPGACGIGILG